FRSEASEAAGGHLSLSKETQAMPITIDVQTGPVLARLNGMLDQINHFKRVDLGAGLSQFQTDDMHRDRPFTMRSRGRGTAATIVRPHSLYEMQQSALAQRRFVRARARYERFLSSGKRVRKRKAKYIRIATGAFYARHSTRAILRAELLSALAARMDGL